ncbi:hypothetical protein DPMN_058148 [Dreissena polymorpha]|uniref:Uncharacterized protein n=1 Tax=Dreissena polymorpha TaxID=45954 RepID=A0A9D4C1M4_DREPO|nr:hypothetical protein DPMN_058148 [Dreissena polymorpha]
MYGGSHMVFSRQTNGRSHLVDVMLSTVQRPNYGGIHMVLRLLTHVRSHVVNLLHGARWRRSTAKGSHPRLQLWKVLNCPDQTGQRPGTGHKMTGDITGKSMAEATLLTSRGKDRCLAGAIWSAQYRAKDNVFMTLKYVLIVVIDNIHAQCSTLTTLFEI